MVSSFGIPYRRYEAIYKKEKTSAFEKQHLHFIMEHGYITKTLKHVFRVISNSERFSTNLRIFDYCHFLFMAVHVEYLNC